MSSQAHQPDQTLLAKLCDAIRHRASRTNGHSMPIIIGMLYPILRGWFAYFRSANRSIHHHIDQTVRRCLWAMLAKRRGCPTWGGRHGHNRRPNAFFAGHGICSLADAHLQYFQSC